MASHTGSASSSRPSSGSCASSRTSFAERELRPIAREWDDREDCPPELLGKAAALGLTSHAIPVEYGGGGVAAVTSSLIAEELSWGCAGPSAPIGATMFPVRPLLRSGTEEQKERWLTRLASRGGLPRRDRVHRARRRLGRGRHPGDRAPRRRRVRPQRREVLRHERRHRGADDRLREARRRDHGVPRRGGRPGRHRRAARSRSSACAPRTRARSCFDEARLPADRLLGEEGEGFAIAMDFFMHSRPQVAASARRDRARGVRVRDRLRERAARVRQAADREAGRLVQARGHGDADRGGAAARLARRGGARRRRGRGPARLLREGLRGRRRR